MNRPKDDTHVREHAVESEDPEEATGWCGSLTVCSNW